MYRGQNMWEIYIVLYNGHVSSEGYEDIGDAIEFVETRSSNPKVQEGWLWLDDEGNKYQIKGITVKRRGY